MEEQFIKKLHSTANLNFLFLSLFVYLLKNCSSQFFSNWTAEPVFCSEELSCLPNKNQHKSLTLSFGEGKFKLAVLWGLFIKQFFHWATFKKEVKPSNFPIEIQIRVLCSTWILLKWFHLSWQKNIHLQMLKNCLLIWQLLSLRTKSKK